MIDHKNNVERFNKQKKYYINLDSLITKPIML